MEKIAAVKGTRDFYPEEMALRNWIMAGWRSVSLRNGFAEYDGPIFEHLQLYTQKSGDEIVSQLFSMQDRGGRDLAIRPEITPTLARMVNQKINSLARPIKWFSMPRLCRAERPQRGRLREFFQWNIDIVGSDSMLADAESIYTAIDYLRSVGLTSEDVVAKISSRAMLAGILQGMGFSPEQLNSIYTLLDKRAKMETEKFTEYAKEVIPNEPLRCKLMDLQAAKSLDEVERIAEGEEAKKAIEDLKDLFSLLESMGVKQYCQFDIQVVRGLAYYTGPVFEIYDRGAELRAICGGGRYDDLLGMLGGPKVPATGFGMGDVVLEILLREKNLLGTTSQTLDAFVIDAENSLFKKCLELVGFLRAKGIATGFDYKRNGVGKQLKQAGVLNARFAVIVGQETTEKGLVTIKNMASGEQNQVELQSLTAEPGNYFT